jgi:uncharacterized membrane protein
MFSSLVLHPATVHIPIGVFFAACVLAAIAYSRRNQQLEGTAQTLVTFSWFCLIPATITGTIDAVQRLASPSTHPDALFWINLHAGSALVLWLVIWQAWQIRRRIIAQPCWDSAKYPAYLVRLGIGFACLILSGWSGGHMVYELNVGILPK